MERTAANHESVRVRGSDEKERMAHGSFFVQRTLTTFVRRYGIEKLATCEHDRLCLRLSNILLPQNEPEFCEQAVGSQENANSNTNFLRLVQTSPPTEPMYDAHDPWPLFWTKLPRLLTGRDLFFVAPAIVDVRDFAEGGHSHDWLAHATTTLASVSSKS